MDYRDEILREERIRDIIGYIIRLALFFASALLLMLGWHFSIRPIFDCSPLSYVQAVGFVIFFRGLLGFPEYGRAARRVRERRMQLQHQAFIRRMLIDFEDRIRDLQLEKNNTDKKERGA